MQMDHSTEASVLATAGLPIMVKLGRLQQNCYRHGVFFTNGVRLRTREVWDNNCPGCADDKERERKAEYAEAMRKDAIWQLEEKVRQAAVPLRFVGKTLDNFNADSDGKRYALTVARDYIETFEQRLKKGDGLILSGLPGTGKSHIAAAILQGIMPKRVGLYMTCMSAIRMVRETWRKDSEQSEREVLDTLGSVPLLVLDEIGVQYGTDGEQTVIFDILDRRYRDMRPSILLTNQDKNGLKTFIGERAYDRLTESCRWVPFDWPSYRAQARKEAA
jgi:DNA replication protein DnaC